MQVLTVSLMFQPHNQIGNIFNLFVGITTLQETLESLTVVLDTNLLHIAPFFTEAMFSS
jgi:hypothetical protein